MPNLFSKIAATGGLLKLFSGGIQQKSIVSVYDVVRCMKFMAEQNNISREITIFIIAHRSTSIKGCDKTINLENGTIKDVRIF